MMPFCDLRPHLTRLFLPAQPQTEFYYFPLHSQSAAPFSPSKSTKENFIFNTAYPPSARLFHPRKAPKRILFLTLHSPSAATFFLPAQPRTEFYFLTLHPSPLSRGPRLPRCITIFSVLSAAFHHAGHRVTQHAEYIQRSCPKCVAQRRNGEIFPPANATAATNRGAGTAIQDEYKKKLYPSARRGIYYTGIIGGGRGGRGYIIRGLSAGEGVVGVLYMDFRRVKGWRGYNNMELRKGWQGGY